MTLTESSCSTDTGTGTSASPYRSLQDAVNAASAGDTIDVDSLGEEGGFTGAVTVTTSDLSIVGAGYDLGIDGGLTIDGVSDVSVSGLNIESEATIEGSSDVTLDSDYVAPADIQSANLVAIDGTSSGVTVSRSFLGGLEGRTDSVAVAAGAPCSLTCLPVLVLDD